MFEQFKESNLLFKTCDDAEIGDESGDNSIMQPLIIGEKWM